MMKSNMPTVEELERQVENLSGPEFREFRNWFDDHAERLWDRQLEADSRNGKLDALIAGAIADDEMGLTTPL